MKRIRVIPVLLMQRGGLVKSVKFRDHKYVGDPINAVKIFNDKEVDEIVLLDISASAEGRGPDLDRIKEIVSEAADFPTESPDLPPEELWTDVLKEVG